MRRFEDMFRPVYEVWATGGWILSGVVAVVLRPPWWPVLLLAAAGLAWTRWQGAVRVWRFRFSLSQFRIGFLSMMDFFKAMAAASAREKSLFLGTGFRWEPVHAENAQRILSMTQAEIEDEPPRWLPDFIRKTVLPKDTVQLRDSPVGVSWIHGLEPDESAINLPISALAGGTLVCGTTRAGKTVMYQCITSQVIHMGSTMIVVDPKGDRDWEERIRWECRRAGRKYLYFHPAHPSKSVRINVLANWNNVSETATRISQLLDADGSFAAFAWKTLYNINRGIVATGRKPSIALAKRYAQRGVEPLLEELLEGHFVNLDGPGWDRDLANRMGNSAQGKGGFTRLTCMMQMYQEDKRSVSKPNETIEALIAMAMHSKEHYSKMIQVLEPLLEMLGSDEVGKLLSPDPADLSDNRQIWDSRRIIDDKCVLYIGLDSLSNSIIGSAIGSIILADLASVAGAIYNAGKKEDVFLFVDEAGEVVNEQLVQILNKAGGAGFKSFLACQTIADFEARMGSSAKAKQVLGNLNNAIVLRLRDTDTAEWVSNSFGTTMIRRENVSHSTGSESSSSFTEFKGTTNRSLQTTESALVDPSLFLRLPAMNYFAYLAGSTLYKGRVPLIEEEWKKAA